MVMSRNRALAWKGHLQEEGAVGIAKLIKKGKDFPIFANVCPFPARFTDRSVLVSELH